MNVSLPRFGRKRSPATGILVFLFWATIFTLAYAQSPLYTSNQNQYFLHGLARAGVGYLSADWLANTIDPTPVFSGLVYLTYRILPWPPIFYIYFGIFAGIYLFSLLGIATEIFGIGGTRAKRGMFLAVLVGLHSAAARYLIVRALGVSWAYLLDGGVAGQRLLGSVLQPSTFGVLLVLSIYLFLRRKLAWAVVCLILASTVHPTYLLSAAALTAVYMGITYWDEKNLRRPLTLGAGALLGVTPILVHTFLIFGGTSTQATARARDLLVHFRIPHHAIPAEWFDASVIVKVAFVLLAIYLVRKTRLFHILLWPFILAIILTLAQVFTGSDILALLFPWRISTFLVPLSVSVSAVWALARLNDRFGKPAVSRQRALVSLSLIAALVLAAAGIAKFVVESHEKQSGDDRPMMAYVKASKSPGDLYLIPLHIQDFRLVTMAPAFVEFKSIPYKDMDVLEWYRRVSLAGSFYQTPLKRYGCATLDEIAAEGVTHVVMPYDHIASKCSNLHLQYQDIHYDVYALTADY